MRRFLFIVLVVLILVGLRDQTAWAIFFIDVIDWDDLGPDDGRYYKSIDTDSFTYAHILNLDPPGISLNSAQLSLTHRYNSNIPFVSEIWIASSGGGKPISQLSESLSDWVTDSWMLSNDVLNEITITSPWSLTVNLVEIMPPENLLWIDKSELSGDYTPIPEPSTLLLLAISLLGMALRVKHLKLTSHNSQISS